MASAVAVQPSWRRRMAIVGGGGLWRPVALLWAFGWFAFVVETTLQGLAAPLCTGRIAIGIGELNALIWSVETAWPQIALFALAMAAIMLVPVTNAALRHVARSSFPRTRTRHQAAFLAAFVAVWWGGAVLMTIVVVAPEILGPKFRLWFAAALLVVCAAWQGTAARRRAAARCHLLPAIYAQGWPGLRSSAAFGLVVGASSLVACGPLMLAAMASPWPLPAMVLASAAIAREMFGRAGLVAQHARLMTLTAAALAGMSLLALA